MKLADLSSNSIFRVAKFGQIPVVMYEDHRWILPAILAAQKDGVIPAPAVLVGFDQHHDSLPPRSGLGPIPLLRRKGYPQEEFQTMVRDHLSQKDDDWLKAGMELGLISDAVVFGVGDSHGVETEFQDHKGKEHKIFLEHSLPGELLGHQGSLADTITSDEIQELWAVLGWQKPDAPGDIFRFSNSVPPRIVDFDLDCFAIYWDDFVFPWPDEVFEKRFNKRSEYRTTVGLSGQDFMSGLMAGAGIITIAREPTCCGGEDKTARIFEKLNDYVFNSQLNFVLG